MSVLQKVRLISNERLDLPDFANLDNFACADWAQYFEKFMGNTPFIIKGFEILNPAPLISTTSTEATVVLANSVMFHPTSSSVSGGFFVATASEANQTVALTPNTTNFIEIDQIEETGAPDTRSVWDASAEGGDGAEFSQIIDTVTFLKIEVSANTIGFTSGKIPIAKVVVDNSLPPVIISITDSRPMFFRLGSGGNNPDPLNSFLFPSDTTSDFARTELPVTIDSATIASIQTAFPGTSVADVNPFRSADKNIITFKDWMDAIMTRIKEFTGSPYWYKDGGLVSGLTLSNLWWDSYGSTLTGSGLFQHSGGAAIGTLTFSNITILDTPPGETFTLDDGVNTPVVFEFDNDSTVVGSNVAVVIGAGSVTTLNTVDEFKDATISAINGAASLDITASDGGSGIVNLTNDISGPHGNVVITETVADAGFVVSGMAGGDNVGTLTWTSDIFVRSIVGNYFFGITASSILLADDEVAYIEQVRHQPLPAGAPLTWVNGKNYVNGALGAFASLSIGDFIKKESDGVEKYVRISAFRNATNGLGSSTVAASALSVLLETTVCISGANGSWIVGDEIEDNGGAAGETCDIVSVSKNVTLDSNDIRLVCNNFSNIDTFGANTAILNNGPGGTGSTGTFDRLVGEYEGTSESIASHYAKSVYTVSKSKRDAVPAGGDTWWLAFRDDNGSNIAQIYIGRTGMQLQEGEQIGIGDQPPIALLNYVGTPSQSDSTPDYNSQASDSINSNNSYNTANGENLTIRASKLTSMMADKAQDKNIEMLLGSAIFTWNLTTQTLSWDSTITFQIPSSNDDNTLASGSIVLASGQVSYIEVDRNNPSALTNNVISKDAVPLSEKAFVWARRDGDDVLIGSSFKLRPTDSVRGEYSDHLQQERMLKPIITQAGANNAISVFPSQRISGNKRRYTYVEGIASSKFPRNGGGAYDGGANNDQLTVIDFDALTTPGSVEVGVTFPSIARSVLSTTFTTPAIGQFLNVSIHLNGDDSVGVTSTGPFASLAIAQLDDNLPSASAGTYTIGMMSLEVTGATTLANITDDRLLDRRPSGQGLNPDFPTAAFDKHQDALTENTFKEIFINILTNTDFIDTSNSANMTLDSVQKALVASANGSFVAYDPKVEQITPESSASDAWTIGSGSDSSLDSIVLDRLRINDTGAGFLFYERLESVLTDKSVVEMRYNLRIDSSSSGAIELGSTIEDTSKVIRVAVIESGGQYLIGFSNGAGTVHIGTPVVVDFATEHDIRILKVGDQVAQMWIDGQIEDVVSWSTFSGPPSTTNRITFGTTGGASLSNSSWGEVSYCVYPNVHSTTDVARKTDTIVLDFKPGTNTPDTESPAWTAAGGATADITTNPNFLTIADLSAVDYKNYILSGSDTGLNTDGFKKTLIWDSTFQISSWTQSHGALDVVSYIRITNGFKVINVGITYDGVTSGIVASEDLTFAAARAGTSAVTLTDVDWTNPGNSIRVEFIGNVDQSERKVRILVNRDVRIEVSWDTLKSLTTTPGIVEFGSGSASGDDAIVTTKWGSIHISKPDEGPPIEAPIIQFLPTLTTSDPHPLVLFSSDNGETWATAGNGEIGGLDVSQNNSKGGHEILTKLCLSSSGQIIDDYSIMYSREKATGTGFFKYFEFTAVGGETLITLPFSYAQGNKELEVIENGLELFDGVSRDYTETSPTSITLTSPADPSDRFKFRVNHRIIVDEDHLDGGPNKHDASEIDVEGTYGNIAGTPTDLESTISSIDSVLGASVSGSTRRRITEISGGSVAPASGPVGATLGFFQALKFSPSSDNDILFQFPLPDNTILTSNIIIRLHYVMGTANAGDVKLDFDYITVNNLGDDLDPAVATGTQTSTFTPGATAENKLLHSTFTIANADISSLSGMVACKLKRDAVNGADTHTGTFDLVMIEMDYS